MAGAGGGEMGSDGLMDTEFQLGKMKTQEMGGCKVANPLCQRILCS